MIRERPPFEPVLAAVIACIAIVAMLVAAGGSSASPSGNHPGRFPVIGCFKPRASSPYRERDAWRYAPAGYCETGGRLGTSEGIDHAHWRGWGSARAHARGLLVDGLGFKYRATITAIHLYRCHDCFGQRGYNASWYERLRVASTGGYRGGVRRGPFNVTMNVTPQE